MKGIYQSCNIRIERLGRICVVYRLEEFKRILLITRSKMRAQAYKLKLLRTPEGRFPA